MSLIVHNGIPFAEKGFDLIATYGAAHRTKVKDVRLWRFERLPYGHISVTWGNGAIGCHTGSNFNAMLADAEQRAGWPTPTVYHTSLPFQAGVLYAPDFADEVQASEPTPEPSSGEDHATKRVVRNRQAGHAPVARQRRVRAAT